MFVFAFEIGSGVATRFGSCNNSKRHRGPDPGPSVAAPRTVNALCKSNVAFRKGLRCSHLFGSRTCFDTRQKNRRVFMRRMTASGVRWEGRRDPSCSCIDPCAASVRSFWFLYTSSRDRSLAALALQPCPNNYLDG